MQRILIHLCCLWISWPALTAGQSVTLNGLECTLDEQSGALLRLTHAATGTILETSRDRAGLLNITYSGKILEPCGSTATLSTFPPGMMKVSWEDLGGPLPDGGRVGATVTFKAAPDGRSVIVSCHLRNEGQGTISQVLFPDLQGLRPTDDPDVMELRTGAGGGQSFCHPSATGRSCAILSPVHMAAFRA